MSRQLSKRMQRFIVWLQERGAEVLSPTNEYEVARWRANGITSVVYRNKRGSVSAFHGEGRKAYRAWQQGGRYEIGSTRRRKLPAQLQSVLDRDGPNCFFCGKPTDEETLALEHLVPLSAGGPNHTANLAISHARCNQLAGSMSAVEKVKLRDELRKRAAEPREPAA